MKPVKTLFLREFRSYFHNPIGAVFIAALVFFSILMAMQIGQLLEFNEASLYSFFQFQPYLLLLFVPALAMRIWADEIRGGTFELLLSLGYSDFHLVLAKFLAGLVICALGLCATFPLWIAINFLGKVDNFVVFIGYIACLMICAIYLIITMFMGLLTRNQIIIYLISIVIGFLFLAAGLPIIATTIDAIFGANIGRMFGQISILTNFENIIRGQIGLANLVQFCAIIAFGFILNLILLKQKRRGQL